MKNLRDQIKISILLSVTILSAVIGVGSASAAIKVGKVDYARGAVTAQHEQSGTRILGKGAVIYQHDVISSGGRSFAVIEMADGTKMTIRPETSLSIDKYIARNSQNDSAVLSLFRGGIRAITGFISKRRQDAYQIKTPVATIGIRGTEFDARLCSSDCSKDADRYKKTDDIKTAFVIGRIAFLRGQLSATDSKKKTRQLFVGGPIYEGDLLNTGNASFAVIAFRDKSRVTLNARSEFEIKKHHYDEAAPENSSALMQLLKGGLRAVSGLIGKKDPRRYQMRTPVATIGIRGTGYDLLCEGSCKVDTNAMQTPMEKMLNAFISPAIAAGKDGMYAHVWDGEIDLVNKRGQQRIKSGQTYFVSSENSVPVFVPQLPIQMRSIPAPRPDKIKIEDNLFTTDDQKGTKPGLYVAVYDGHVIMQSNDGQKVDLGKGEAAFTALDKTQLSAPVRLPALPAFQINDAYPRPESFSESWENLFNRVTNQDENSDLQCVPR